MERPDKSYGHIEIIYMSTLCKLCLKTTTHFDNATMLMLKSSGCFEELYLFFFLIYSFLQRKGLFAEIQLVYGAQIFLFEKKMLNSFYPFEFKSLFRLQNINRYCIHGETLCNDRNYLLNLIWEYKVTQMCRTNDGLQNF